MKFFWIYAQLSLRSAWKCFFKNFVYKHFYLEIFYNAQALQQKKRHKKASKLNT